MSVMEDKNIHSNILKQVCKELLLPLGIFQKGSSRIYLDDNGYFFTVIEFQPSGWSRGTYLNIGLTFLWEHVDEDVSLTFTFSRGLSPRYGNFVAYKNETQFRQEVTELVNIAKNEVLFYRQLRDLKFAKEWMTAYMTYWERNCERKYIRFGHFVAKICSLDDDKTSAEFYYRNYCRECAMENKEPKMGPQELNKDHLVSNIRTARNLWHSKPSMKKMPVSPIYDA